MLPGLEDRADLIRWLKLQLDKAGVEIQIGSEATPESIKAISPDAVITATGARYSKTGVRKGQLKGVPGATRPHDLKPEELLPERTRVANLPEASATTSYETRTDIGAPPE